MAAGTTQLTKTLDQIGVLAAAYTGIGAARTFKGYKRFADAQNFEALVEALTAETQGYFSFWIKRVQFEQWEVHPATIIGELAVSLPKGTTSDVNAAWDFCLGLVAAIGDQGNWNGIGLPRPGPIVVSLHKIETVAAGGIIFFDFGNYGDGGITVLDP